MFHKGLFVCFGLPVVLRRLQHFYGHISAVDPLTSFPGPVITNFGASDLTTLIHMII